MKLSVRAVGLTALAAGSLALAQPAGLVPLESAAGAAPPEPWRVVGLPKKFPLTGFELVEAAGERALRITTDGSYGNLVHAWQGPARTLQWRWRLERPLAAADLRSKQGDDVALKVCLLFDLPLSALPFGERTTLALARAVSGEALPAATLCYVWDTRLPVGTLLPNAYSERVRYLVLSSGPPVPGWQSHRRDVAADFLRAFGHESAQVPPLSAVAVGADADNTRGSSLGWVTGLSLSP
jgi:hypothetical protein